jgi:hypothetical protein
MNRQTALRKALLTEKLDNVSLTPQMGLSHNAGRVVSYYFNRIFWLAQYPMDWH